MPSITAATVAELTKLPVAVTEDTLKNFYVLVYRDRYAQRQTKQFYALGGHDKAKERGILHCTRMNYRFIGVNPMFTSLDEEEAILFKPMAMRSDAPAPKEIA